MTTVAMNNLWNYIQGLNLSARNKTWLANQLLAENEKKQKEKAADPTAMSKEEFFAQVEEAERQIERGEGIVFTNKESMNAWLNSL